ncbi:hypothetical protein A464_plas0068 (plasmid) [Salmonella bongori N268-08]|uniref:Uncharacterized protein n=1 Tax=Salmonella bongori N268-08 TaxID=1197719 RepID=S5NNT7_SALBN|nr:hypothetical protein A464_plas0068 [Salmonella bongori N268-08]
MTADVHGILTGHVFADFIHHLRGGHFPLTSITSAGINQGFVVQVSYVFSLTGGFPRQILISC